MGDGAKLARNSLEIVEEWLKRVSLRVSPQVDANVPVIDISVMYLHATGF